MTFNQSLRAATRARHSEGDRPSRCRPGMFFGLLVMCGVLTGCGGEKEAPKALNRLTDEQVEKLTVKDLENPHVAIAVTPEQREKIMERSRKTSRERPR